MHSLASLVASQGSVASVTFDQRGIGQSAGRQSVTGFSEIEDTKCVIKWLLNSASSIVLLGSSAGANIAGSTLSFDDRIKGYIGIGYVCGFWARILFGGHIKPLSACYKPKLFIHG
eukprot:GHVP01041046.1.p1 GENE.GHVP01041046.1~~GHVP01041046.1.p1  ORF type:complete len:116 (-),score=16.12 GHVP01041046.1:1501-1848(-)